jgi:TP901 family phage tail tape measure protein
MPQHDISLYIGFEGFQSFSAQLDAMRGKIQSFGRAGSASLDGLSSRLTNVGNNPGLNSLKGQLQGTGKAATSTGGLFANMGRQIQSVAGAAHPALGSMIGQFGAMGVAVGGVAAAAVIAVKSLTAFMAFEDSLLSLQSITGVTNAELEKYAETAQKFAGDKNLSIAAGEAVKAFELVGSAQPKLLESRVALEGVTKAAITLNKAAGGPLTGSVASLTDTMNQFNKSAGEASTVINVLAAGSKFGAAPINDVTAALNKFGSVAQTSKVSIEESVAAVELLAPAGLKGAEAGTKLLQILLRLAGGDVLPANAQQTLRDAGVNMDVLKDTSISLSDRLKELSKIGGDSSAIMQVFGTENEAAALTLINNADALAELTGKLKGTNTAFEQAAIRTQSLSTVFEVFRNRLNVGFIQIGQKIAPVVRGIFEGIEIAFNKISPLVQSVGKTMMAFGKAIQDLIGQIFGAGDAGDTFGLVLDGLVFSLNMVIKPTQWIIQGVTWLIEKFIEGKKKIDDLISGLGPLGEALKVLLNPLGALRDGIGLVVDGFNSLFGITEKWAPSAEFAIGMLGGLKGATLAFMNSVKATDAQMVGFIATINKADYAGLSLSEQTALLKANFESYKSTLPPTVAGTESLTVANVAAAGSMKALNDQLSALNTRMQEAATHGERVKILGDIDGVRAKIRAINEELTLSLWAGKAIPVEIEAKGITEFGQQLRDLAPIPGTVAASFNDMAGAVNLAMGSVGAAFIDGSMQMEASRGIIGTVIDSIKDQMGSLKEIAMDVRDALVQGFGEIAFSLGQAIAGTGTAMDAFRQFVELLLVKVPKLVGFALINQAAAVPSPASLPLAIAGLALIGLSGLVSGILGKKDAAGEAAKAAQSAAIGGTTGSQAGQLPGLSGFGAGDSKTDINIQVNLDSTAIENAFVGVFENGQEVRGRR